MKHMNCILKGRGYKTYECVCVCIVGDKDRLCKCVLVLHTLRHTMPVKVTGKSGLT